MNRNKDKIAYALFDSPEALDCALKGLDEIGVTLDDISILMSEDTHEEDFAALDATKTAEGAATGTIVGGFMGAVLGGLVAIGSAMTGGIGLLVMGPALTLAAAGGLIGGFIGHGMPEAEAKFLLDEVAQGKVLLAAHVDENHDVSSIRRVLQACKGEQVDMPQGRAAEALAI